MLSLKKYELESHSTLWFFLRVCFWFALGTLFCLNVGTHSSNELAVTEDIEEFVKEPSVPKNENTEIDLPPTDEKWYIVSSFTRTFKDKHFARRTAKQLYGHLPLTLTFRACYARQSSNYHLIHDTTDYAWDETMPETVRGPNPSKNRPIPIEPWSEIWNASYSSEKVQMPPHWNKVFSLLNLIKQKGLTNDWMVWMDGDMNFFNFYKMEDLNIPRTVSVVMPPLSDFMFWIRMDEYGKNFLETWLDLAQGRKIICEHRFGIPEYHDLYWFWVTAYHAFDMMYHDGVSTNDCNDFRPFQEKWLDQHITIMRNEGKRLPRLKIGIIFQRVLLLHRQVFENWQFGRKAQFADYDMVFAIHSKHPFQGWHLRSECNRFRLRECVEKYHCGAILLDENRDKINDISSRSSFTGTKLIGTCDENLHDRYEFKLPDLLYANPDRGKGCSKPGCDCWDCTCEGFSNTDRSKMSLSMVNDFGTHFRCERDMSVDSIIEDSWVQHSRSIKVSGPIHIPNACKTLQNMEDSISAYFLFNGTYATQDDSGFEG